MLQAVPLRSADVMDLKERGAFTFYGDYVSNEGLLALEGNPYSMTIIDEAEQVIGCGGAIELWENRAHLWLVIDRPLASKRFYQVHNVVNRYISLLPYRRIEAMVEPTDKKANRWMPLLGFTCEGLLRKYDVSGSDMFMWSKITGE